MRPEARLKCGFYPAPPEAVLHITQFLTPPADDERFAILDPCAGQGEAINQLAEVLDCDRRDIYAVELDSGRADSLHSLLDEGGSHVLAPADYFGVSAPAGSFSFIWCNPPFDDEYGGGSRVEREFLETAIRHLRTRGILALVCPRTTANRYDIKNAAQVLVRQRVDHPVPRRLPQIQRGGGVGDQAGQDGELLGPQGRGRVPRLALRLSDPGGRPVLAIGS